MELNRECAQRDAILIQLQNFGKRLVDHPGDFSWNSEVANLALSAESSDIDGRRRCFGLRRQIAGPRTDKRRFRQSSHHGLIRMLRPSTALTSRI